MKKRKNKVNQKLTVCICVAMMSVCLVACKGEGNVSGTEIEKAQSTNAAQNAPEIFVEDEGKAIEVNGECKVLETYKTYNIQAPVQQIVDDFAKQGSKQLEFQSHTVAAEKQDAANEKYDVTDTIKIVVDTAGLFDVMPQKIEESVVYKREKDSGKWVLTDVTCSKWECDYKQLGGTVWKMSTQDGEKYIRLRDTIEFFYTKDIVNDGDTSYIDFDTTILGACATVKDDKVNLERIHIMSGTITTDGTITLKAEINEEKVDIVLNEYEPIEKADLPFTEEEYKAVADQR